MDDGGFANGCSHEEEIPDMENEIECDEFDEEMDVDCDGPSQVVRKMNGWHSETSTGKKTRERQGKTNEPPPEITQWIEENYEVCKGSHVARETVYSQYCHFCQTRGHVAVNSASFGKIMHQHFKGYLKTRRLGTRGQSKYHYEGVQIKEDSEYFGKVESFKSLAGEKKEIGTKGKPGATSPGFNVGSLLPSFPNAKDLDLTPELKSTVETFIMMYRTHCQRILIAVSRANFDDVHSFLLHFWQGLPDHLQSLLELDLVTDIVGYCDCLLSKVIIAILIASPLQALPDSLTTVIRQFSCQFQKWLDTALSGVPAKMLKQKKVVAKEFCKSLRRQTALTELCQSVRNIVRSRELISQMISDWKELDLNSLVSQCLWTIFEKTDSCQVPFKTAYICLDQFQCLLENQLPLEKYAQWIETLMMEFTVMRKRTTDMTSEDTSREFLLKLSFCTAALIKDLTLHSSPSFGSGWSHEVQP
ncbi:transcription factor RFX4-like isoform X2 [Corticium candelabrum]|uniref:transcription factor RFX4-like isoform X2 n=1 Tax=Corticium candelabrum TaxID=121492 RepID=UPI002E26FE41|nr:transcription factor RFX4-like isoform X2 [Corticium candelabrum]